MNLTRFDTNLNNIQNLPDSPAMGSKELKQVFDKSGLDIQTFLNDVLLPELEVQMTAEIKTIKADMDARILEDAKKKYYVGKIIMDTENINPAVYLGFGTWELWGSGRVPVGVDINDEEFNTVEKTGGEKAHTMTLEELVKHRHTMAINAPKSVQQYANGEARWPLINDASSIKNTSTVGESKPFNIMQPYITCYMWKRTA